MDGQKHVEDPMRSVTVSAFLILALSGCDEQDAPKVLDTASSDEITISENTPECVAENSDKSELYQAWIDRMDPFVYTNDDGTFWFDSQSFGSVYSNTNNEDLLIIGELEAGLPIVNDLILEQMSGNGAPPPYTTHYYWWGLKTCYYGDEADTYSYLLCIGVIPSLYVPILGAYMSGMCATSQYMINACPIEGFCMTATWAGGWWITCP